MEGTRQCPFYGVLRHYLMLNERKFHLDSIECKIPDVPVKKIM